LLVFCCCLRERLRRIFSDDFAGSKILAGNSPLDPLPLGIASTGAHWGLITESPNELIISLTNFSVKLNTPITQ